MNVMEKENSSTKHLGLTCLLAVRDLEKLLRVDRRTIYRMCENGQLPRGFKIGGANRWRADAIMEVIEKAASQGQTLVPEERRTADIV